MKKLLALLCVLALCLCSFPVSAEDVDKSAGTITVSDLERLAEISEAVNTVIDTPLDVKVTDEASAMEAIGSVADQLGCDENTRLVLDSIRPTETGLTYYTFYQAAGDIPVTGGAAKLVVDQAGTVLLTLATIHPDMPDPDSLVWKIDAEMAEQRVLEEYEGEKIKIISGITHQTLLPSSSLSAAMPAWVVYTDNLWQWTDAGFLAHYLTVDGEYLSCVPVTAPRSEGAQSASGAELVFLGLEPGTWTGTVTLFNGETKELTVPTLTDPETGKVYLGDLERKIVCADYASFKTDTDVKLLAQDEGWDDGDLLILNGFIEVWDFYNDIGWTGADGEGSPTLLLMNWVKDNGEPVRNACYSGQTYGFQVFQFNRVDRDGECPDLLAHEFTHCVTDTFLTHCYYKNDTGAIDEAISDIMGNLIEEFVSENASPEWLIGEGAGDPKMVIRNMSNPHAFEQPAYVWDLYYSPTVEKGTDENDLGGVHTNSSLLNLIAWRLHEAGMPVEEECYFWMNVMMTITPGTDYPQLAKILPWVARTMGYDRWLETLQAAIEETKIADYIPDKVPEGCAMLLFSLPKSLENHSDDACLSIQDMSDNKIYSFWIDSRLGMLIAIMKTGTVQIFLTIPNEEDIGNPFSWTLLGDQWYFSDDNLYLKLPDDIKEEDFNFILEAGDIYEIPVNGLS